jgi:hypothetical protein
MGACLGAQCEQKLCLIAIMSLNGSVCNSIPVPSHGCHILQKEAEIL